MGRCVFSSGIEREIIKNYKTTWPNSPTLTPRCSKTSRLSLDKFPPWKRRSGISKRKRGSWRRKLCGWKIGTFSRTHWCCNANPTTRRLWKLCRRAGTRNGPVMSFTSSGKVKNWNSRRIASWLFRGRKRNWGRTSGVIKRKYGLSSPNSWPQWMPAQPLTPRCSIWQSEYGEKCKTWPHSIEKYSFCSPNMKRRRKIRRVLFFQRRKYGGFHFFKGENTESFILSRKKFWRILFFKEEKYGGFYFLKEENMENFIFFKEEKYGGFYFFKEEKYGSFYFFKEN